MSILNCIKKPREEQSLHKNNIVPPKAEKAPLKPHANISASVNLGAKRATPTVNGYQDQDKENTGSVSAMRVHTCPQKKFGTENGGSGVKENGSAQGSSSYKNEVKLHPHELTSDGGDHHKDNLLHPWKNNDGSQNETDHQEMDKDQSKALGSSTKEEPCILLRKAESSRHEFEAIKESLKKDASSFLRSCGWYDQVHTSMRAKKRLCTEHSGVDGEDSYDLKRRFIGDVKSNSLQIPDELKAHLVNRLRNFFGTMDEMNLSPV